MSANADITIIKLHNYNFISADQSNGIIVLSHYNNKSAAINLE